MASDQEISGSVGIANVGNIIQPTIHINGEKPLSGEKISLQQKYILKGLVTELASATGKSPKDFFFQLKHYMGVPTLRDTPVESYQKSYDFLVTRLRDAKDKPVEKIQPISEAPAIKPQEKESVPDVTHDPVPNDLLTKSDAEDMFSVIEMSVDDTQQTLVEQTDEIYLQIRKVLWLLFAMIVFIPIAFYTGFLMGRATQPVPEVAPAQQGASVGASVAPVAATIPLAVPKPVVAMQKHRTKHRAIREEQPLSVLGQVETQ